MDFIDIFGLITRRT